MDKESIDRLKTGNETESIRATLWSVHHLKRSSPIANQVMIDILVMSNRDRNALAAKRKSSQHLLLTTETLRQRWSRGYKTSDSHCNHKWYWLSNMIMNQTMSVSHKEKKDKMRNLSRGKYYAFQGLDILNLHFHFSEVGQHFSFYSKAYQAFNGVFWS